MPRICRRLLVLLLPLALATLARADDGTARTYIVQLRDPPAIGAPETAAAITREGRFNPRATAVRRYAAALTEQHDALLDAAGIGAGARLYSYRLTFNGFAARLTPEQAARLAADPAVLRVWEDTARRLRSNASPGFLGLLNPSNGLRSARGLSGKDIVIGVIDSGITPGHPSFSDTEPGRRPRLCRSSFGKETVLGRWLCKRFKKRSIRVYDPLPGWQGQCESGDGFSSADCNNKLIGARFYRAGFLGLYDMDDNESISPRDADGHGTHIASVAAGNPVTANIGGRETAPISGVAPRARIAVYKACWLQPGAIRASCAMSDLQRAIEDAIADGVDIINYSVGTTSGGPADPDSMALLAASDAGVLAVVAAGNGGPLAASIESPGSAPWVLTVGAASRAGNRYEDALRVTGPAAAVGDFTLREAAFTPTLRSTGTIAAALVRADDGDPATAGADASPDDACQPLLNAGEIADRIALVRRGGCTFQEKITHAAEAGAVAVIVYNNETGTPITMTGARSSVDIPAGMISLADGESLAGRLDDGETVEVRLEKGQTVVRSDPGNVLTRLSARGANPALPDVLKPDVVAPGTDILGAQTPDVANGVRGESYQYLTGTSMAVPHVAGVAALLLEAHPDWSPAVLRSALVTSARQDVRKEDGASAADPFDFGGGYIVPDAAFSPGLVFDAGTGDYDAIACGSGFARLDAAGCATLAAAGYPTDGADLNLPSIAAADVVTHRTTHRYVTNVGATATYTATVTAPPGVDVVVSPDTLSLASGEGAQFTVTLGNRGEAAQLGQWSFGSISWNSADAVVRMPLAVRPWQLAAPSVAVGEGTSGTAAVPVQFGYEGDFTVQTDGLAAPAVSAGFVTDDPLNLYAILDDDVALPNHVRRFRIPVPEGTRYLRVGVIGVDPGAEDDLDLYLFCPDSLCPDGSAYLTAATTGETEIIDILDPVPGEYVVDIHGYETDEDSGGPGANFELGVWTLAAGSGLGTFSATAPSAAAIGASASVNLAWQGLDPGQVYLGLLTYGDGVQSFGDTLVEISAD